MRSRLGRFSIGRRVFVVGAIPVLVAAAIALGAWTLLFEAERARMGAVLSTETLQTLISLNRARADVVNGASGARAEAERRFGELSATAAGQLARLSRVARTAGQSALVATVSQDLATQVERMRALVVSEEETDRIVGDMSRRADGLVALTDAARTRQQDENARLIAILARKDTELEKNQGVVTGLRELREAIATAELNRVRVGRPVFPIEFEELATDLRQLDAISARLRAVLTADGDGDAADEAVDLLRAYRDRSRSEDDLTRAIAEGFELTRATQSGRALTEWCDRFIRLNVARQSQLHGEVARLIRESVRSNEAGLSAQTVALTSLKLAQATGAALARRNTGEAAAMLAGGADLSRTAGTLPIPEPIRGEMIAAIDGWRAQLATTIEQVAEQNGTIVEMDGLTATMGANAQTLAHAFVDDADQFGSVIRQLLLLGALGALLLGTLAAMAVARSITRPLRELQSSMLVAAGDATAGGIRHYGRRDELGDIARASNVFLAEIRRRETGWRTAAERADQALRTLRQAQEDLVRSERLASLGQLVAGVSHEISTPLGIALTTATQVQADATAFERSLGEGQLSRVRLTQYVGRMREGAQLVTSNLLRAADLLYSFKQVAADQVIEDRRAIDLAEWIEELLKSLRALARPGRHILVAECPADLTIDTLPGVLAQVVTNAVKNAVDHGLRERENGRIVISAGPSEGGISLAIADDGRGIEASDMDRVFDPFFTTARTRGGTGLGLHIVHNLVVNRLQGRIELHSRVGEGTRLVLWLPERLS